MKLDLVNSRLEIDVGSRVYDSIEGNYISKTTQKAPQNIVAASFRAKGERIETNQPKVPDRFNQLQLDCKSNQIGIKTLKPISALNYTKSNLLDSQNNNVSNSKQTNRYEAIEKQCPSIKLDYIKDRIYNVKEDTVQRRINDGNLSGGVWPLQGRKDTPPKYKIGPGSYEVYDNNLGKNMHGGRFSKTTSTALIASIDGKDNPDFLPLKVRQRLKRIVEFNAKKSVTAVSHYHSNCLDSPALPTQAVSSLDNTTTTMTSSIIVSPTAVAAGKRGTGSCVLSSSVSSVESIGTVKFNSISRFNNPFYKQETYVKTSGMLLDLDWDKKLNKKITLDFAKQSLRGDHQLGASTTTVTNNKGATNEGGDVDVDVGHVFSIVNIAAKSPVRYSAAFKSNAKVGMDIPTPTSGTLIGPGSYKDAFKDSIEIKEKDKVSYYMLRGRSTSDTTTTVVSSLDVGDDSTHHPPIKSFSEMHKKGPSFNKYSVTDGNVELKRIIQEKVRKIYPQLAKLKFTNNNTNRFKYSNKIFTAFPKKPKIK